MNMIIAEIGNNHEGSFKVAKKMILAAYKAGVDAVKFQTFKTENYVNISEKKRFSRLKKFELSKSEFVKLSIYAKQKGLLFISTPFDLESANFLKDIVDYFKISSGDNNYYQLIEKVLSYKKPTIISCGLLNDKGISTLLNHIKRKKFPLKKITLMHCVSSYPVPPSEANLNAITYMKKKFKLNIGYSDHTVGISAAIIAKNLGASVIEKHFTLNKKFSSFRDHILSSDPTEMKVLVNELKNHNPILKIPNKNISKSEKKNLASMRRSIYSITKMKKNERITENKIKIVRPFGYFHPIDLKKILNKKLKVDIQENQLIIKKILN